MAPLQGATAQAPAGFAVLTIGGVNDNATWADINGNQVEVHLAGTAGTVPATAMVAVDMAREMEKATTAIAPATAPDSVQETVQEAADSVPV